MPDSKTFGDAVIDAMHRTAAEAADELCTAIKRIHRRNIKFFPTHGGTPSLPRDTSREDGKTMRPADHPITGTASEWLEHAIQRQNTENAADQNADPVSHVWCEAGWAAAHQDQRHPALVLRDLLKDARSTPTNDELDWWRVGFRWQRDGKPPRFIRA